MEELRPHPGSADRHLLSCFPSGHIFRKCTDGALVFSSAPGGRVLDHNPAAESCGSRSRKQTIQTRCAHKYFQKRKSPLRSKRGAFLLCFDNYVVFNTFHSKWGHGPESVPRGRQLVELKDSVVDSVETADKMNLACDKLCECSLLSALCDDGAKESIISPFSFL